MKQVLAMMVMVGVLVLAGGCKALCAKCCGKCPKAEAAPAAVEKPAAAEAAPAEAK